MAVAVNIYIKDTNLVPEEIVGVIASIYNPTTLALIASATSDIDGLAAFSLTGSVSPGTTYEVRFFKIGVLFANPVAIQVIEPAIVLNKFDVTGTLQTLPVSTDPRTCRCTGIFVDFANRPMASRLVRIMAKMETGFQVPKLVDNRLVAADSMEFRTDANGKLTVDLIRTGEYYITFSGDDDTVWNILVPDRSSVNLIDLIHPQPVSITWDQTAAPGNAISIAVGEIKLVPFTALFSDFEQIDTGLDKWFIAIISDNTTIGANFALAPTNHMTITGVAVGTATITFEVRGGLLPKIVPPYSVEAAPLVVTVTP